jgi:replication-associated recombination protein RarA
MKDLDYGKDYKYTPKVSREENKKQTFLPLELKGKKWIRVNK